MPVYFGHAVTQRNEKRIDVSSALKQLGINLLRAAPSDVVCDVLPYVTSPMWSMFIASLSALMFSVSEQKPVSLNLAGYRIDTKHKRPLPWFLPRVSIEVRNKGAKQVDWLLENGFEEQTIRDKSYFVCEEPTSASLQPLLAGTANVDFNDRNYVPMRTVNISSLLILSEMINTLSYLTMFTSTFLYDALPSRSSISTTKTDEVNQLLSSSMQVDTDAERPTQPEVSVVSGVVNLLGYFQHFTDFPTGPSSKETVSAASATPNPSFASPNLLTNSQKCPGLFLRYVPDLSDEDPVGVVNFFSKYLRRSLGTTAAEIFERLDDYRSAWGILKSTPVGHTLSHLVRCLEIGFDAHCGIVPIFSDGFYEGCALIGNGFSLNFRTELHLPLSTVEFATEMLALETNKRLFDQLHTILTNADVNVDHPSKLHKPAALRRLCLLGDLDGDKREEILKLIRKIRFPYSKWPVTLGSVSRALTILTTRLEDWDDEVPVGPEGIFSTDPVEVLMSCFKSGACPSFRHPSGVPIDLSAKKAPAAPKEIASKKGKGPGQINNGGWVFSIRRVDIVEAVSDFRTMIKEKEARSMGSAASKGLGYFVLSGGNFERVFALLKGVVGKLDPSSTAEVAENLDSSVKRGRNEGFDEGGAAKSKRKMFL